MFRTEEDPNALRELSAAKHISKWGSQAPIQLPMPEWALDEESRLSSQGSSVNFAGQIKPLPAVVFPIKEAPDALRQLSAAKHIGKVVIQVPSQLPAPEEAPGRWIISGGLGALGTLSVQWLASQGNGSSILQLYITCCQPDLQHTDSLPPSQWGGSRHVS